MGHLLSRLTYLRGLLVAGCLALVACAGPALADPASISLVGDYIWADYNGNGVQDDGAGAGLGGVAVNLYHDDGDGVFEPGSGDAWLEATTSAADGHYSLATSLPGGHWVEVDENTLPGGLALVEGAQSLASPAFLIVEPMMQYGSLDFGYSPRGSIWGVVFYDYDLDGQQGLGEPGVLGAELCLYRDVNANGLYDRKDTWLACQLSDLQGGYVFSGLLYGHYLVVETARSGIGNTTDVVQAAFVDPWLAQGVSAGPIGDVALGKVGGVLFVDANGNQIQDAAETLPVPGATVQLSHPASGQTWLAQSAVDGSYAFPDLLPGVYELSAETSLSGYSLSTANPAQVLLGWGGSQNGLDFAYTIPTSVVLADFFVEATAGGNRVSWHTSSEQEQEGFTIWRGSGETGPFQTISALIPAQNAAQGAQYQWLDLYATPGQAYWYRLQSVPDGEFFGPVSSQGAPALEQNRIYIPIIVR